MKRAFYKIIISCCLLLINASLIQAQCDSVALLQYRLLQVEGENADFVVKQQKAEVLKNQFEQCGFKKDSIYARILHKLAVWQYYGSGDVAGAIQNTQTAIAVNTNPQLAGSAIFAVSSYNNLGIYYMDSHLYRLAIEAYQAGIDWAMQQNSDAAIKRQLYFNKAVVYKRIGSYQEALDANIAALNLSGPETEMQLRSQIYTQQAELKIFLQQYDAVQNCIDSAALLLKSYTDAFSNWADLYAVKASLAEETNQPQLQQQYQEECIRYRQQTGNATIVNAARIDLGVFYDKQKLYPKALAIYHDVADHAGSVEQQCQAYINLSGIYVDMKKPRLSVQYSRAGLHLLMPDFADTSFNSLPTKDQIERTDNPLYVFKLLANKAEALHVWNNSQPEAKLAALVMPAFRAADIAIDEMRLRQTSELTRLYWQQQTRVFYQKAIDAATELEDAEHLFYFMEKSRAVLLNDKLNELGALAMLPRDVLDKQQFLQLQIATLEMQRDRYGSNDETFAAIQNKLYGVKDSLNRYIKSLEHLFPDYYQYKYHTAVPRVTDLKNYLQSAGGSYVAYFETDSLLYALLVTPEGSRFSKIVFPGYRDSLNLFLNLCGNKMLLNARYRDFSRLSHLLYNRLVVSLQIPKGKVYVSTDMNFIPFDALASDEEAQHFLVFDYRFDYAYSAGYLLKASSLQKNNRSGFLGIAPESFASYLSLATLSGSVKSLNNIATYYSNTRLAAYKNATRSFFLKNGGAYSLLHLYVHARVSQSGGEPVLYMSDSAISVSELRRWNNSGVGFAFLAACETAAGEVYMGEGVNSLARSFAAVGIPSTVATLWRADNEAMYKISERFYFYLRNGLDKTEALQKAKLDFIKNGGRESRLPFYWAAAVLLGDDQPVHLRNGYNWPLWLGGAILILALLIIVYNVSTGSNGQRVAREKGK